ncbi:hypothetical protein [Methylobacterium nigriterrae]|uniref:hypothetical protein n=1 Tax=Methylobacterium nigriterrae TaxID=3127512 RepID=UPI003013A0F6
MTASYGDRFDGQIRAALKAGDSLWQIALDLGVSRRFVWARADAMGLKSSPRPHRRFGRRGPARFPSYLVAIVTGRSDPAASRLAAQIRARDLGPADLSDNAVACLHEAGLTLDDLQGCAGIAPAQAVAAIRRCAEARAA